MANYLIVYAGATFKDKIDKWLCSSEGAESDLLQGLHDKGACYYLARCGKNDATCDGGVFKGYAIDHDSRKVIYSGGPESPYVHRPLPGCYVRVQCDHNDIVVGNDLFAQLPMLYFAKKGVVAVSDSVFILTELRKHLDLPNRIHEGAALSRAWIHGMASQCLGTQTIIDGIYYCPPGTRIHMNLDGDNPTCQIKVIPARELFSDGVDDYKCTILQAAERTAALIATVLQIPGRSASLSLSGGLDSRVCLAAALTCNKRESLFFKTNRSNISDYNIAKKLAQHFKFDFKDPPTEGQSPPPKKDQLTSWMISNAGLYDPLACGGMPQERTSIITGAGAETCKGNFGWRPLSATTPGKVGYVSAIRPAIDRFKEARRDQQCYISNLFYRISNVLRNKKFHSKADKDISSAAYREACQGLQTVGIDIEDPWGTEWHYLFFRNGIHFSRASMTSLLPVSPLLQQDIVRLSRSTKNEYRAPKSGSPSIITDMLIVLNPELAKMPFDDPQKNLDAAYVAERSNYLGHIREIAPYFVVGDPSNVNSGTPTAFISLASARGYTGCLDVQAIKSLAKEAFNHAPAKIRDAYQLHKYIVDNDLPERISTSSWECNAAGKLMSLLLAD